MAISNDKMSDSIRSESIDFSIIKTDPARATFEQAKTFAAIFESEENRLECFRWLLANDPTIHTLYGHALKHGAAADPLFILLALVNLLSISD